MQPQDISVARRTKFIPQFGFWTKNIISINFLWGFWRQRITCSGSDSQFTIAPRWIVPVEPTYNKYRLIMHKEGRGHCSTPSASLLETLPMPQSFAISKHCQSNMPLRRKRFISSPREIVKYSNEPTTGTRPFPPRLKATGLPDCGYDARSPGPTLVRDSESPN